LRDSLVLTNICKKVVVIMFKSFERFEEA